MRKLSMSAARFLPAAAMLLRVSTAHADIDATGDWLITHEFLGSYVEHWTQTGTTLTTAGGFTGAIDPGTGSFSRERPPLGVCPRMNHPDTLTGTVAPDGHTLAATHTVRSGTESVCLHGLAFAVVGTRCGVGKVDPGEECDDGNMQSGDGCDAQCQVEPCFLCSGEPSLCTPAPAGAACDDGNPCIASACDGGGMCAASGPVDCDDGRGCTLDSCDALLGCVHVPDVRSCRSAQTTKLVVNSAAATDKLLWKWLRGESTSQSEFADPLSAAAYSFCVFAGTAAIVVEADIPPDAQRWTALGSTGFKYRDASGAADGMQKIILRGSDSDATKIAVKGSGAGLSLTEPPLVPPLTAQLTNHDTDVCWSATYEMADILRNLQGKLKAKTSSP